MTNSAWINLPVKDAQRSKAFFEKLGADFVEQEGPEMFGIYLGKNKVQVMMFGHSQFEQFTQSKVADLSNNAEILISMEAQSRQEVEELAKKVTAAGGIIYGGPETWNGWMYGMGFQDLDGHRWNIAYLDWDQMPKEK